MFAGVPVIALLIARRRYEFLDCGAFAFKPVGPRRGGHLGGAPVGRAALRVTLGGALAMSVSAIIGRSSAFQWGNLAGSACVYRLDERSSLRMGF